MRMTHYGHVAVFATAAALGILASPAIDVPAKKHRVTTKHPRNGKREVARRLRQIAAGQLTRSNGLVTAEELRQLRRAA